MQRKQALTDENSMRKADQFPINHLIARSAVRRQIPWEVENFHTDPVEIVGIFPEMRESLKKD